MNKAPAQFLPQTLEVDERLFDKSLRIVGNDNASSSDNEVLVRQDQRKNILQATTDPALPAITVIPDAGMCVKSKNVQEQKFFINFCKINAIPPARPISEEALQAIIASEDYATDYKIPMSLGAPRNEKDKSGKDCLACDVAVNSVWYDETMQDSLTFTTFLVNLAMEGLCDKYGDVCNIDRQNWSILRNKRYMGKLQRHTIEQRANMTKIQDLSQDTAGPTTTKLEKPQLILVKEPHDAEHPKRLVATINLPRMVSRTQISLEVGEDRLVMLGDKYYSLDIFLPYMIVPSSSHANFHREDRVLTVTMKVVA